MLYNVARERVRVLDCYFCFRNSDVICSLSLSGSDVSSGGGGGGGRGEKRRKKKLFDGLDFLARKREKKKRLYFYNTKIY